MKTVHRFKPQLIVEIDFNFWSTPCVAWNGHSKTLEIVVLFIGLYIDFVAV